VLSTAPLPYWLIKFLRTIVLIVWGLIEMDEP
jgi:hypothetical protein